MPARQKSAMMPSDGKSGYILRATGPSSKERKSALNSSMTHQRQPSDSANNSNYEIYKLKQSKQQQPNNKENKINSPSSIDFYNHS